CFIVHNGPIMACEKVGSTVKKILLLILIHYLCCSCFCCVDRDDQTGVLQQDSVQKADDGLRRAKDQHKISMKNKYESLFERNRIYTQLRIIHGESEGVNEEHEVLHMEKTPRLQDTQINCNNIFKDLPGPGREKKGKIKAVLTKGMAGIGKTVSVQKFLLDWAEGKANQDVDFMLVLPFRELNLIRDHQYSLHRLLLDFHPELQDLNSKIYEECNVVFIFDGLDESRIEIQGFNDPQKEEYFRKRISDEQQVGRIISHIKKAKSLHIMCHIPVFCWISATVLQQLLKDDLSSEVPQTLTEMYIHFLLTQINMGNQKYKERDPEKVLQSNREVIVKLAELAFNQLMKGNVMFYEEDLIESGIDVTDTSVYSGICTEIFKEESVIHQRKVYSFIHLSFQEFLAALYVSYSHVMKNMEPLQLFKKISLFQLQKSAVDKTHQIENGHLDLFLRFLLGISLDSNQELLKDLLPQAENNSKNIKGFMRYIQEAIKRNDNLSANRSINLFLCLLEMNDQTLYQEIQEFVKSDKHSDMYLSVAHCSVIAYVLQTSEEVLDELTGDENLSSESMLKLLQMKLKVCHLCCESLSSALQSSNSLKELDLSNNALQDSGVNLLSAGLKSSHCQLNILRLVFCNLTGQCCESSSSALQSSNSQLRELDLSSNDLQDSGVKLLSVGFKSSNCQLNKLRLSGCMVTEKGCGYVSSALRSNPSHLRELDLSYNNPGESGVQLLKHKLQDPNFKLQILKYVEEFRIKAGLHKYFCDLTLNPITANKNLVLSEDNRKVTYVEEHQAYPDHPERFERHPQVLSRESLSGRCYWEAEWSGHAEMSVAYKGISRKGKSADCWFGFNNNSWRLSCFNDTFCVWYSYYATDTHVPLSSSNRVGVYVDVSAGILSFYSVSDTHKLTHIHTFNNTFTEPLYAGFGLISYAFNSTVSLCPSENPVGNNTDVTCTRE
uniref:B30.2/SPRY domain-containing protein n=1 Tax=Sinocyclocheilus rhinocerous TaxID=307959 RepID=A0A673I9P3_9TELE